MDLPLDQKPPMANGVVPNGHVVQPLPKMGLDPDNEFPASLRGKKMLLATESLGPINGVSRTTSTLIEYLRRNGVEVAIIAPKIYSANFKSPPGALEANRRLTGYPLPYNPDLSVVYPFRLTKIFRRTFKPDLIYLASPASVGFQFLVQIRQLRSPPPVILNFQTDLSFYSEIIFPPPMAEYAVWLLGLVQGYLFSSPAVDTVFYPCSFIQKYLERVGTAADKLTYLGRGVDTTAFAPSFRDDAYRAQLAPNGELILLSVCRLAPEKGFAFLADAAIALHRAGLAFTLVIVGGNKNASVQAEVQRLFDPISSRVVFTGFRTGAALAREYASADVFLHCSVTETFGLVVLEAMASGLPVVARDQGGPSEIVRHDKTGFLVPIDALDDFTARITTLAQDPALREDMAAHARAIALDTTWDKINLRASRQMARAVERHAARAAQAVEDKGWLRRGVEHAWDKSVGLVREKARLYWAVGWVWVFWVIAVLPLIIHGQVVYATS